MLTKKEISSKIDGNYIYYPFRLKVQELSIFNIEILTTWPFSHFVRIFANKTQLKVINGFSYYFYARIISV